MAVRVADVLAVVPQAATVDLHFSTIDRDVAASLDIKVARQRQYRVPCAIEHKSRTARVVDRCRTRLAILWPVFRAGCRQDDRLIAGAVHRHEQNVSASRRSARYPKRLPTLHVADLLAVKPLDLLLLDFFIIRVLDQSPARTDIIQSGHEVAHHHLKLCDALLQIITHFGPTKISPGTNPENGDGAGCGACAFAASLLVAVVFAFGVVWSAFFAAFLLALLDLPLYASGATRSISVSVPLALVVHPQDSISIS